MDVQGFFPIWAQLTPQQQNALAEGAAREVVTRMLRCFQSEGLVRLSRGSLQITNKSGLEALGDA